MFPKLSSAVIARLVRAIHAAAPAEQWITRTSRVMTMNRKIEQAAKTLK